MKGEAFANLELAKSAEENAKLVEAAAGQEATNARIAEAKARKVLEACKTDKR